ncbi:cytosine permease [Pseudoalteromonas luteoviolacea]|uniref:Cytosine permease n=1 Tax=Pseudoalteromonas luteoviolacea TaxID=43657 RepID=A0A0C1MNU6_9GAMM|nr:cytosine permease [Pseudoalteromonas luteoviolacea]KID58729.1 cytosine permease [Pseudoalteromonas luteoviolacea]
MSAHEFDLKPVPTVARRASIAMAMLMLGLTFFSASMWTGGKLGVGLSQADFITAVVAGNLILAVYTAFLAYIGAKTGLSTHLLARFSFGLKGSWLPSALLAGTQVGWFGVGIAMFALPVSKITGFDISWLILIAGTLMTATAYIGISALMVLSMIAVPAIALLGGFSVWLAIDGAGGLSGLAAQPITSPLSQTQAITLVVGSFISAGTLTADFMRFGKNAKKAVLITVIAFLIGNSLMFVFGGAGAAATGKSDISEVLMLQGLLLPAVIVLGLNIWTTNDNALYASGLGFANITGLSSKYLSVVNGLIGTLCALWLYNHFVSWLTFLSAAIPPIGGVLITHYLTHKTHYQNMQNAQCQTINWNAIISVFIGIAAGHWLPGITPVNAVIASAISFFLLSKTAFGRLKHQ